MPQISDPSEAFAAMGESFEPSKAAGVDGTIQMELSGEGGGTWAVKISDGDFVPHPRAA